MVEPPTEEGGPTDGDERRRRGRRFGRRRFLRSGAALLTASATAGCLGRGSLFDALRGASTDHVAVAEGSNAIRSAFDPNALTADPADTRLRTVDGTTVVFQYGRPIPSFDTWNGNGPERDHRSLDGEWQFRFDPKDVGLAEDWHTVDPSDEGWTTVSVPLPWDLYDTPAFASYDGSVYGEGTAFRDGFAWYRRRIRVDDSWAGGRVRAHFLGVNYLAWVFLDGDLVGVHEGGNAPFAVDLTDNVDPGETQDLAVRVYRPPWWNSDVAAAPKPIDDPRNVPSGPVDYWPYAGLTRSVYLEAVPTVSVSKLLLDARDGLLDAAVVLYNAGEDPVTKTVRLDPGADTGGDAVETTVRIEGDGVGVAHLEEDILGARPWSPGDPTTYTATASIADPSRGPNEGPTDRLASTYGMRTVGTDGNRLTISGDSTFLKGINWHEETPARGRSLTTEDYADVVDRLSALGVTLVRNSHYVRPPVFYDLTDEAGITVLDEAANTWMDRTAQRVQLTQYGLSRALVASMVWNQHNHPSVALWSVHNESDAFTPVYQRWLSDLLSTVRAVDRQDRPVTWASKTPYDSAFDEADVIGLNEYYGYFEGSVDDLGRVLDAIERLHPETPILITENGSWTVPDRRGPPSDPATVPGTPEWQAATFREHWERATDREAVAGYTYWVLSDYKQRTDYNRFEYNGISTMGLTGFGGDGPTAVSRAFRDARSPDR